MPPLTTTPWAGWRGQWRRPTVVSPAFSPSAPPHRAGDAVGYGLDALAPLCTPIGKQRLPMQLQRPKSPMCWLTNGFLLGRNDIRQQSCL